MNKSASYDDISLINVHNITLIMVFDYVNINAIAKNVEIEPVADQHYELWNSSFFYDNVKSLFDDIDKHSVIHVV